MSPVLKIRQKDETVPSLVWALQGKRRGLELPQPADWPGQRGGEGEKGGACGQAEPTLDLPSMGLHVTRATTAHLLSCHMLGVARRSQPPGRHKDLH